MTRRRSVWIATVLILALVPILFLFQNCAQPTQFKIEESSKITATSIDLTKGSI